MKKTLSLPFINNCFYLENYLKIYLEILHSTLKINNFLNNQIIYQISKKN